MVDKKTIIMSDSERDQGPKSTFTTYMAEGDQLYHKGEYLKAIESYTTVKQMYMVFTSRVRIFGI